jgi:hypothetical protein
VFIWSDVTTVPAGDFLYITDVQLERGSVATEFNQRTFPEELATCKRYCSRRTGTAANQLGIPGYSYVTNTQQNFIDRFEVEMRAAPTFSISAASDFYIVANATTTTADGLTGSVLDPYGALLTTGNATFGVNVPASLHIDAGATGWLQYSAEL